MTRLRHILSFAKCFDVGEVGCMFLAVHVFGKIRVLGILLYRYFVFLHPCASISRRFADVNEITILTGHLVDDSLVLLGFIEAFLDR